MHVATTVKPAAPPRHSRGRRRVGLPEIALILSTYQKPRHLRLVLASIAQQQLGDRIELVVTDDGSTDETPKIVERFAEQADFPVSFTTHPHEAFQLARCRNEGVAASTAPYLLFLDGDCLLPRDHVFEHLRHRRHNYAAGAYCARLDEGASRRIDAESIRTEEYLEWVPRSEIRSLAWRDCKARFGSLIRHPSRPKLAGGNIGVWREDFERINGYDENFQGWGAEDDDLCQRLRRVGVRIASLLRWTRTYHLWHPVDPSAPTRLRDGRNMGYLHRSGSLARCRNGLVKRRVEDLDIAVVGRPSDARIAKRLLGDRKFRLADGTPKKAAEVEILFLPGSGRFHAKAACRVLVVDGDAPQARHWARKADYVVSNTRFADVPEQRSFRLDELDRALEAIC